MLTDMTGTDPLPSSLPSTCESIATKEQQLDAIKTTIEQLSKTQQMEVLKIFKKYPLVKLNENRNGVYINLSYLPEETIVELNQYLNYVNEQETNLEQIETQKEEFKSTFFLDVLAKWAGIESKQNCINTFWYYIL